MDSKNDLKYILKRFFRDEGANLSNTKLINQQKILKNGQKLVFKFDRLLKNA